MPAWKTGLIREIARQAPAGPPPLTPEYMAFNNSHEILSITGSFFALAAFVVLLRIYVRVVMLRVFGSDDYVMVAAMLLCAATFGCFVAETKDGLGKHFVVMLMDPITYMHFAKTLYVHSIIVMVGVSTVKVSIALFLMRLGTRSGAYNRFLWGVIGFIIVLTITCAMTLIFQCFPVEAAWDYSLRPPPLGIGTAKCYNMNIFRNLGLMNSSFNIVTDALFATLPIPLIWQLQLNMRTKLSLIAVLSLGWFACAAAIIKAVQQWNVLNDPDWTVHDSFNVWNYIEFTIGIIAASLPALKPLFNWFLETARAITSGGRTKASGYNQPNALGYHKTTEGSHKSIALQSITSKGDTTPSSYTTKNPYNVRITGAPPTSQAEKEIWDMDRARTSDESILPLQNPPQPGTTGILMTREVRVN